MMNCKTQMPISCSICSPPALTRRDNVLLITAAAASHGGWILVGVQNRGTFVSNLRPSEAGRTLLCIEYTPGSVPKNESANHNGAPGGESNRPDISLHLRLHLIKLGLKSIYKDIFWKEILTHIFKMSMMFDYDLK